RPRGRVAPVSPSPALQSPAAPPVAQSTTAQQARRPRKARKSGELIDARITEKGRLDITRVILAEVDVWVEEITTMWVRETASGLWASSSPHARGVPCRVIDDRGRHVLLLVGRDLRKMMATHDLVPRPVVVQLRHRIADGALTVEIVRYGRQFSLSWAS
ncbi:MAG: hypothetical protein ACYDGN_12260, partial [Acidimicrobiales bacterium]